MININMNELIWYLGIIIIKKIFWILIFLYFYIKNGIIVLRSFKFFSIYICYEWYLGVFVWVVWDEIFIYGF